MTTYYVDSAAGSNTSPYDTWAKAATALATIAAIDLAGDSIYVASTHNETTAGNVSLTWNGTQASPTRIICADKTSGAPPSTIATGGTVTASATTSVLTPNAGPGATAVYIYGIKFVCASTSTANAIVASNSGGAGGPTYFDNCSFQLSAATGSARIAVLLNGYWRNCTVKFGSTGQNINGGNSGTCALVWDGGGFESGSATPSGLGIFWGGNPQLVKDVDFSNLSNSMLLLDIGPSDTHFFRCKFPSGWSTSSTFDTTPTTNEACTLTRCGSSGIDYGYYRQTAFGTIAHDTQIVRTGGSTDGTTPLSWKMTHDGTTGSTQPFCALYGDEFAVWNDALGSPSVHVSVYTISEGSVQQGSGQFWIEVIYPKDSGDMLGGKASSAPATPLVAGVSLTIDNSRWDSQVADRINSHLYSLGDFIRVASNPGRVFQCTAGGTSASSEPGGYATATDGSAIVDGGATFQEMVRNVITVAIDPQQRGPIYARPHMCGPSGASMWVDRKAYLS